MKFHCLVAAAAIASSIGGCVVYPTATVRVSPNYTATGSLPGVRADVYGHRTLLEFADEPSFLTVIDTFGNEVPYEKEGRYFRLAKKLDHFAVKTGLHTVHFNIIDRAGAQKAPSALSENAYDPQAFPGQSLQYAPVVPPSTNKLNMTSPLTTARNPFPAAQATPAPASLPLMASTSTTTTAASVAPYAAAPVQPAPKPASAAPLPTPPVTPPGHTQSATATARPAENGMKPPSQPILPLPSQPKRPIASAKASTKDPVAAMPAAAPVSTAPVASLPIKPAIAVTAPAQATPPPRPPVAPVALPKPKEVWEAKPGMTLQGVVQQWSVKAGWKMDWKAADLDYPIDYPLSFEGTYEVAIKNLFDLYSDAKRSFIVNGSTSLKTLNVCEFNNRMGNNKCL